MPRDSAGNYTLPAGNPVAAGTVITSNWANTTMSDVGNEITNSLSRDGQGGMLSPLTFVDGALLTPGIAFTLEPGLGFYRAAQGDMRAAVSGIDAVRFTEVDQLEMWRDHGTGFAWWAAMDIQSNELYWDVKLGGFKAGGLHYEYVDDLNALTANSEYFINAAIVLNEPADFVGLGVIRTMMTTVVTDGIQMIYGQSPSAAYKVWMRELIGGVWSAWTRVVDGLVVPAIVANNTADNITFTGIPADTRQITLTGIAVEMPAIAGSLGVRWGTGGVVDVTNYVGLVSQIQGNTASELPSETTYASLYAQAISPSDINIFKVTLDRVGNGNSWLMTADSADVSTGIIGKSSVANAPAGPLDTVSVISTGGFFVSGTVQLRYET